MAKRMKPGKQLVSTARSPGSLVATESLLDDVRKVILQARTATAQAVNVALVMLYWQIGQRIRKEILKEQRAGYGEEIVAALSRQLTTEFGRGFAEKSLRRMIQFAEVFPDQQIVAALSRQLGWSHFVEILPLRDPLRRDFYAEMCRIERWSVRTLRAKVQGMLFERTGLSRKPAELARRELLALREEDQLTPDLVFRDPYFLDFLGLADTYSEKDLEAAILRELERFILELGAGFAFVDRQKRLVIDGKDYYIDLLFYHRRRSNGSVGATCGGAGSSSSAAIWGRVVQFEEGRPEQQPSPTTNTTPSTIPRRRRAGKVTSVSRGRPPICSGKTATAPGYGATGAR